MNRWERCSRKYDYLYAVVLLATLALTNLSFVVELVEHAGVFTSDAGHGSEARSEERAVLVAEAGEVK